MTLALPFRRAHRSLRSLMADGSGVAGIEFAMVAPLLLGLLIGGVTLFDMYRYAERAETVTYTIADLLSRRDFVDKKNLEDLHATHAALLGGTNERTRTRMSSVVKREIKENNGKGKAKGKKKTYELVVEWTYDSENVNECKPADNVPLHLVPDIAVNDSVVIVETDSKKRMFTDRINDTDKVVFVSQAVVRPRYVNAIGLKSC